ncbi:MAG: 4Fe-4S binding protein [Coprobacillus sp.]
MIKYIAIVKKGCVACGTCMKVCPRNAIKVEDGIKAVIDKSLCVGCGLCVKACPAGIIEKVERD